MKKKTCECGKEIEGYSKAHCEYLLERHRQSKNHKKAERKREAEAHA